MFLITALLITPAAFLFVAGDQANPLEEARKVITRNAKESDDRTAVRARLEELGKASEEDYEAFRIKQYGYSASGAAISLIILYIL
jgi:hypothetical protein